MIPYYPSESSDNEGRYEIPTFGDHLVAQYAGLNIFEVQEVELCSYLQLLRDAYISELQKTEGGQEYLENAWRLTQTEPGGKLNQTIGGDAVSWQNPNRET